MDLGIYYLKSITKNIKIVNLNRMTYLQPVRHSLQTLKTAGLKISDKDDRNHRR